MPIHASLTGTVIAPRLELAFPFGARLPGGAAAMPWVKNLPDRFFEKSPEPHWVITGTGKRPGRTLTEAGLEWVADPDSELADVVELDDLWRPVLKLSRYWIDTVLVYPRFAGYTRIRELVGPAAVWERDKRRFQVRVTDLVGRSGTVPEKFARALQGPVDRLPERAARVRARAPQPIPAAVELAASSAVIPDEPNVVSTQARALINEVAEHVGHLPAEFGLNLYPYQEAGAYAAAAGVRAITDEPGLGKCLSGRTRVLVGDSYRRIDRLWDHFAQHTAPRPDHDGIGEVIELPPGRVPVKAMPQGSNRSVRVSASHLYRERINAPVKTVTTRSGSVITATLPHRFLTREGWKADIEVGDEIASTHIGAFDNPSTPSLKGWTKVTRVDITRHKGWVYDLTVPEHHNYLAEDLYCHNTRTSLAAAALVRADRVLVICPPLVMTNWSREASTALGPIMAKNHGNPPPATGPKKNPDPDWTTIIRPGPKVPPFPDKGILVVADSLLASRHQLAKDVLAWAPEAVICDEVHRLGNWTTSRGSAVRMLTGALDAPCFALTGTPMQAKPTELANQLAITGALERDFGSPRGFLTRYTKEDKYGSRYAIKKMLPTLGEQLKSGAMVRRLKKIVLPQLPKKLRALMYVDIQRKVFDQAHTELEEKVAAWVDEQLEAGLRPDEEDLKTWAKTNVSLISPLRVAAGRAKVPAAIELLTARLEEVGHERSEDGGYTNPIIVWAHHQEVLKALVEAMPEQWPTEVIDGSVNSDQRAAIADRYQAGKTAVLFCSIVAAGFGITLTRGCEAYFVETDWTPANISQAEDRQARIGQTRPVTCTTLVAEQTLDPHIRAVLHGKEQSLDVVLPGSDHNVTAVESVMHANGTLEQMEATTVAAMKNEADILVKIAEGVLAKRKVGVRR